MFNVNHGSWRHVRISSHPRTGTGEGVAVNASTNRHAPFQNNPFGTFLELPKT